MSLSDRILQLVLLALMLASLTASAQDKPPVPPCARS